jgi:hypothetical protein
VLQPSKKAEEGHSRDNEGIVILEPHPAALAASKEELQVARTRLVSLAASRVRFFYEGDSDRTGVLWCGGQAASLEFLDAAMAPLLPLSSWETHTHVGPEPTPTQTASSQKKSPETLVLATVYCPGWRISWIQNILLLIIKNCAQPPPEQSLIRCLPLTPSVACARHSRRRDD